MSNLTNAEQVNSAMGLQATAATKRKHEITFDSKDANTYTNCPPPVKTSRWSSSATTTATTPIATINNNTSSNNYNNESTTITVVEPTTTTIILANPSATNDTIAPETTPELGASGNLIQNSANCDAAASPTTPATSNGNPVTITPTNCATSSEDSIAKLEVVAAAPCEPWNTPEPVDCISKLQAVAVPSDPWGSISTRSTLATTLLSTDEMDDDDDDFEDDYEEEESIIPTYCPLRYHACPPAGNGGAAGPVAGGNHTAGGNPASMQRNYSPANGYNTRPNYYSEPFPQQNCSRTGNQHLRMAPNSGFGSPQWSNSPSQNGFYVPPEAAYSPPQQTIRCAENGKSYLELGCSPSSFSSLSNQSPVNSMVNGVGNSNGMDARHPLKRCCDGRAGTWCSTNKNCYKDVRLKIRNLSMFKLSRFRQVSEQSLYRSVLICNTLKHIDREIESEAKEMHQQQHQHHLNHTHHPHQSHLHHHAPHHGGNHQHHHHNSHHHHQQQQHLQSLQHQQQPSNANGEYSPAMGCARVTGLDYHQMQHQHQHQQNQFHSQQQPADNRNGDCTQQSPYMNSMSKSSLFHSQPHQQPHPQQQHHQQLQHQHCNSGDSLHPYDHYPFRESQSGRATPFPSIPNPVSPTPVTPVSITTTSSDSDSGYGEDESNRSINWSSVLSLSSQSALDPLNNNDLFTILPPATSSTSPPSATPVSLNSSSVSISGTFTASSVQSNGSVSTSSSSLTSPLSSSTPTTFTTLSTISSSTYSLTSSSASSFAAAAAASSWEYGFLDMDFGLGSEFTELVPSCKLSSEDLFKSVSPVSALSASRYSSVHDNELEHPAHIMVGS